MTNTKRFLFVASGIFVSFFFFGLAQEKITKTQYVNPDGSTEKFTYSMSLVVIYCGINFIMSFITLKIVKQEDTTSTKYYSLCGFVYFLAMICSNLALQFISYPSQVIAKSCKPIPVMIFGVLLGRKSYSLRKYIFVGMIITGVIMFLYKEKKGKEQENSEGFGVGEFLVLSSLFMDGIIAALQERMREDYQTKSLCMMTHMNKWALVYLGILWVFTKELFAFVAFLQRQPSVLWKLSALSFCGFFGQLFIMISITEFGTLPASIVTTVRKFFTVLVSVFLFGNSLLMRQWLAAVIIFSGLFLDILFSKSETKVK